jgi:hypothetical protein
MNHALVTLPLALLACSCTSIKPQSHKPPSYYGRTDAEIAAMEAQQGAASSSAYSSQTMHTEYTRPYKRGDLALLFGSRQMRNKDAWSPVGSQLTAGINWNWEPSGSLLGFDTSFFYSEDQSTAQDGSTQTTVRGETYEFSMGAIKSLYLGRSPLRAYLGAGISMVSARLQRLQGDFVDSGSDTTFGGYGRIGIVYQIAWDGHIGFDYRALVGTSNEINGYGFDSDYDQFTFNFGTSF